MISDYGIFSVPLHSSQFGYIGMALEAWTLWLTLGY